MSEMHYDFKKKFDKIDSHQNRNLLVPEIDWILNEAQNVFVDLVLSLDINPQRNLENIRTLIIQDLESPLVNSILQLPGDFKHYLSAHTFLTKGNCKDKRAKIVIQSHGSQAEDNSSYCSSFEWREINGLFSSNGIKLYDDGTFTIGKTYLTYVKNPRRIHNAKDFVGGTYRLPSGEDLVGSVECELPKDTHGKVVDIAVLIATGEINPADFQTKLSKLQMLKLL